MKRFLLTMLLTACAGFLFAQTTYYWVGGASSATINTGANWNTSLDGSGATRPSSSGATDILVFDGTNLGGATPVTGPIVVHANAGITAGQLKFINNATVSFVRNTTGTSTINLSGGAGDDFVIAAGSSFSITSTTGSIVIAMVAANTGRVSGNFSMITPLQARIANTTGGSPGSLIFEAGSNFTTNITAASAAYAFGNSTQSSEKWVVFQSGSHLYYDGGFSPMGSNSAFSPIEFQSGSIWHHRANNPTSGFGSFFNTKSFANISVENGATLSADGPIYRIDTLTVTNGSSFITHSAGSTVIRGDMVINGSFSSQPVIRNNTLVLAGDVVQNITGSGTITIPSLTVADKAIVELQRDITALDSSVTIYGAIDFNTNQLSGTGNFTSGVNTFITGIAGTLTAGSAQVTAVTGTLSNLYGLTAVGTGIPSNTTVVNYSGSAFTINLSKPATTSGTAVTLSFVNDTAFLATSNPNGFDPVTGSIALSGNHVYEAGTSYRIDAATVKPFGVTTGTTATSMVVGNVELNASVTTNTGIEVHGNLNVQTGKVTIRPLDTVWVVNGSTLSGNFSNTSYFVTEADATTGAQGVLRIDGITSAQLLPVGTANFYMPATITPASSSDFTISVFEGITANGLPDGTPLTPAQKQTKVDAVWNINRISGTGTAALQLQWAQALEGSTFITMAGSDIGIIFNQSGNWTLPTAPGDNSLNTASDNVSVFGAFSVGAQPPAQAFVFNAPPVKTYGDPDFNGGAISANTTQPIVYTSSNPAVATIVNNNIHITGVGTTNITASQASDGFYPAVSVTHPLTVVKADLLIQADDKAKPEGDPNPPLTVTYTGFVNGETAAVFTTPLVITTTATTSSPVGTYPIVPSGATAGNYNITFINGTLTVTPRQNQTITFNALPVKTYGNGDFSAGAISTNSTIPITYTSSNPAVATVTGSTIHIVGAGTTTITASQAGNAFYFPAANVSRTLTVNIANLTVRALDTTKIAGQANPPFTIVYTGFVLGENTTALTTVPVATTIATTTTSPGYYPIEVSGGVSSNYNFVYTNGRLTIFPASGNTEAYIQAYMSSSNNLVVKVFATAPDLGFVNVYDMNGRLIVKKNVFMAQGFLSYNIPVEVTASGIYIVRVNGSNVRLTTTVPIIK